MSEQRHVCPFCTEERGFTGKPNLSVNTDREVWWCHRCRRGGTLATLPLALREQSVHAGATELHVWRDVTTRHPLALPDDFRLASCDRRGNGELIWHYLTVRRRVGEQIIAQARLGWAPSFGLRVIFPMTRIPGYVTRSILPGQTGYKNAPGFSRKDALYDPWVRLNTTEPVYLVEGPIDALRVPGGVATLGKGVTTEQLDLLAQHTGGITVALDGDTWRTSRAVAHRLVLRAVKNVSWAKLPAGKDPGDLGARVLLLARRRCP